MTCDVCKWDTFFATNVEHDMLTDIALHSLSTPSRDCLLTYFVIKARSLGMCVRFIPKRSMQYVILAFGRDEECNRFMSIKERELENGTCLVRVSPNENDILRNVPIDACICCAACNKQVVLQ